MGDLLGSLIVRPDAQHPDDLLFNEDLIDQSVLNIDATRVRASQVADQFFEGWWVLKRIGGKNRQQVLHLKFQSGAGHFFGIFERLLGKHKRPTHHSNALALSASGSAMPALIDSRNPGTASKYKVS